ncbi:MAG: type I methionyl aminopeptidase [Candidatus Omnitrophota bacterium]
MKLQDSLIMDYQLNHNEIIFMRKLGKIAATFLRRLRKIIRANLTTKDIEGMFDDYLRRNKRVESAFLGYNGYPASLCVSVNEEVIHGIPNKNKVIKNGDIVSVDLGLKSKGLFVDCAYTYRIGKVSLAAEKLIKTGMRALKAGIKNARINNRVGDISSAVQKTSESNGYAVIRKFVGHGIGKTLHCYPEVPNFGNSGNGPVLQEGMVLAIEPMIASGSFDVETSPDGWTVKTQDNSLSCHFEHTVAITKRGPWILTN